MKAALCKSLDGPQAIEIEDIAAAPAGPGQVVITVRAAALNFMDVLICKGKYQFCPDLPFSPAAEVSGVISAIGEGVSAAAVGDRVCAFLGWGGAREEVVVDAGKLIRLPDGVSHEIAAGISVTYGTAFHGLKDRGELKPGETVAILGASGGAGLAAVQIAKRLGARVIAVASTDDRLRLCREQGADDLLDYSKTNLRDRLRELTSDKGVDIIYDCIGGDHAEAALRAIAWQGRYLVVGFASGTIPQIPLNLTLLKGCDIRGVFWSRSVDKNPQAHRRNMFALLDWIAGGDIKPHIGGVYPLAKISEAISLLEQRKARGKLVVTL